MQAVTVRGKFPKMVEFTARTSKLLSTNENEIEASGLRSYLQLQKGRHMAAFETVEKLPPDSERTWAARGKRLVHYTEKKPSARTETH